MAYADHFRLADDLIVHLDPVVAGLQDQFISSRYTGFVSVAAVTVYELAVKDILCSFGETKHKVLGSFARSYFDRINGRIKYSILKDDYVIRFGEKYLDRFVARVNEAEKRYLVQHRKSLISSYNNIITWRNAFAHEGQLPKNATYLEAVDAYHTGKIVLQCLAESMRR